MADIQMCLGMIKRDGIQLYCHVRKFCKRFMATASEYQSYGHPTPNFDEDNGCDNFMEVSEWKN